ncbi:hypothetical protein [Leptospira kobayashii]|uniref:hypothetical protein n=1 Tax=Leptospira kobayashii TaxID=1917830 RepID=UPI001FA771D5|nr:hypothetical protein [Leptospira kobayashii]
MKIVLLLPFISIFSIFCSGKTANSSSATALLLANESGVTGCTIAGIGNQIKAGYTGITTTSGKVQFKLVGDTYYAVMQITGAQIATNVVFNQDINMSVYSSSSCPLKLDTDPLTKDGTEYTRTVSNGATTFAFLKAGSYLFYLYQKQNPDNAPLTVITTGTPVQSLSGGSLTDLLNGNSSTTFKFACDNPSTGICQNYYGSFTDCLSGGTKQTAKCTEDATVVGSCKLKQSGIGAIISVYKPPLVLATATSACSSPGTFQAGTSVQTP